MYLKKATLSVDHNGLTNDIMELQLIRNNAVIGILFAT